MGKDNTEGEKEEGLTPLLNALLYYTNPFNICLVSEFIFAS